METNLFEKAVEHARAGRKEQARGLFQQVLRTDPANEMAWVWYSDCMETVEERAEALQACLNLNPDASQAQAGLAAMKQDSTLDLGRTRPVFIKDHEKGETAFTKITYTPEDVVILNSGSNVFTVPPAQISPDEFARYEARAMAFLEANLEAHPREEQKKDPWAQLTQVSAATEVRSRPRRTQPVPVKVSNRRRRREVMLTALTLLTVVVMFGLLIGAAILMRGA